MINVVRFRVLHLFCGLGGGALGFQRSSAKHRQLEGRFETLAGVDIDPEACADFERLTGAPAVCADLATMTPEDLRAATRGIAPDVIFTSPPCKGFSGLISKAKSETEKYQALNRLVFQGLFTALEAFPTRPKLILLENVPRIRSREQGKELLHRIRTLLAGYGYVFHDGFHDCGELGGLSQRRKRFLLIARHAAQVPVFVYQPPKQRVRSIGECLSKLPLPDDPASGPMHKLPRLKPITMVRLALIPAGKDWRALGTRDGSKRYNNVCRIVPWDEPSIAVTGGGTPSCGGVNVADPRFPGEYRRNTYRVVRWDEPSGTVTAQARASTGPFTVADPRFGASQGQHHGKYRVEPWDAPAHTITGSDRVGSGALSVADPRSPSSDRPIIIAADGTWHRPLTTLELAALQGLPVELMTTKPLTGRSHERWRERIGNAVPPPAAQAIGSSILRSLTAAHAGADFVMSSGAIWVRRKTAQELQTEA